MTEMNESTPVEVVEDFVLKKFEGEPLPENEFERLVVRNGDVVEHLAIENGEPVGTVEGSELVGKNIGRLLPQYDKEVD